MLKKSVLIALAILAISSTASAQTKVQVSFLFGYTLSDGVSGDARLGGDGNVYDRVDPNDGGNLGLSVGFMVNPNAEVGFMYRRQFSKLNISGPSSNKDLGDLSIDGYHGYFAYYFGDPEAKVNPYFLGGFGATHVNPVSYSMANGGSAQTNSGTEFSSTWGAGIRVNAATHFALKAGVSWTPTYIKSDATGWWCDPYWGCYVVGNAQYMNQFHFEGGVVIRY
jgi:outer membrane protein W